MEKGLTFTYYDAQKLAQEVGKKGTIVIPDAYTSIEPSAFDEITCEKLVIGKNINRLSGKSFYHANIKVVDLSKAQIKDLERSLFSSSNVKEVTLPESLETIGEEAFCYCDKLEKVNLPLHVREIRRYAFQGCYNLKDIKIPYGVESIGQNAFASCIRLENVTLPNSLIAIERDAFSGCGIKEIIIPDSVKRIDRFAFYGCSHLENIKISKNVIEIGDDAFNNCSALSGIELPESLKVIGKEAFSNCSSIKDIKIPKKVSEIKNDTFNGCTELESVTISDSAFEQTGIKNLILPNSVKSIGYSSFRNCKIEKLVLPKGLETIGDRAFQDNENLEEVIIPDTVQSLGEYAFDGCNYLKNIKFSDALTELNCQGDLGEVERIVLPKNLNSLGHHAFVDSINLREVIFPETVTEIGEAALANTGIEHVNLPNGLLSIGSEAFSHCSHLKDIELPRQITILNQRLFEDCKELREIKFNENLKHVRSSAFRNCSSLTSLEFPSSVTHFWEGAFENCENLERIVFNSDVYFNDTFKKLLPKTKFVSFKKGSKLEGSVDISPLRYYTEKEGQVYLTAEPVDETSFCFGDYVRKSGEQPKFEYILDMPEERENLKRLFKECPMVIELFNLIKVEKGLNWLKDFYNENKNNLKFFKQCAKLVPKGMEKEFCVLYYDLGGFEKNYSSVKKDDEGNKTFKIINYSQRVGEFLKEMLVENQWFFDKKYLKGLRFDGIKEDFSNFILNKENFFDTIKECEIMPDFFERFYNEFEYAQMQNKSNKGSQRQLKPTIKSFEKYLFRDSFVGATEHLKIAYTLQPYFTDQKAFIDAVKIDNERIDKHVPNNLLSTHFEGFSEIDEKAEDIKNEAGSAIRCIIDLTNKLSYEFLSKDDPQNFILGKLVDCCAHLEAVGFGIMHASITHPNVQNLVLKNEEGRIIAKSTLYVNRKKGYGVFNNVEITSYIEDFQKEEIYKAYMKAVKEFAEAYNQENPDKPLKILTVGSKVNSLGNLLSENNKVSKVNYKALDYGKFGKDDKHYNGDSAEKQYVLWEKEN